MANGFDSSTSNPFRQDSEMLNSADKPFAKATPVYGDNLNGAAGAPPPQPSNIELPSPPLGSNGNGGHVAHFASPPAVNHSIVNTPPIIENKFNPTPVQPSINEFVTPSSEGSFNGNGDKTGNGNGNGLHAPQVETSTPNLGLPSNPTPSFANGLSTGSAPVETQSSAPIVNTPMDVDPLKSEVDMAPSFSVEPATEPAPSSTTVQPSVASISAPAADDKDTVDIMSFDDGDVPPSAVDASRHLESGEPPLKRQRADDSPATPAPPTHGTLLSKEQLKYCGSILRQLKKPRDAAPFLHPVDPVALNIPHYPTIVTNPMDLSTVESKLQAGAYTTREAFISDVRLIFANCAKFNGPESPFTAMAKRMEELFDKLLKKMPIDSIPTTTPKSEPRPGSAKSKGGRSGERRTSIPVIRRNPDSNDGSGRPKREIHPPAPKELPYSVDSKPRRMRKSDRQMRFCKDVVKEMSKKSHLDFSYPFLEPVDWLALNIPDYPKVIKKPMDLSTIRGKLESGYYNNASEFEADVRLMFQNCYRYNQPGQPVHGLGKRFEAVFDRKWKDMPEPTPEPESEEDEEEESEDEDQITRLQSSLVELTAQLANLRKGGKKVKKAHGGAPKGKKPKQRRNSVGGHKGRGAADSDDEPPVVSFEQKRELSDKINELSGPKLQHVVQIIHASMPHLKNSANQEEIELDIDALDARTLFKLYSYVTKNAPSGNKRKRAPAPGKSKRQIYDETEQEQKMALLQQSLDKYKAAGGGPEGATAGKSGRPKESSSESGSDSSGSDSDSSSE